MEHSGFNGGFHAYDKRFPKGIPQCFYGSSGRCIASDHYNLALPGKQKTRYCLAPAPDILNRPCSIGTVSRIGHINQALPGKKRLDVVVNDKSTYSGIHYTNG